MLTLPDTCGTCDTCVTAEDPREGDVDELRGHQIRDQVHRLPGFAELGRAGHGDRDDVDQNQQTGFRADLLFGAPGEGVLCPERHFAVLGRGASVRSPSSPTPSPSPAAPTGGWDVDKWSDDTCRADK